VPTTLQSTPACASTTIRLGPAAAARDHETRNHDWGITDLFQTFGVPSCPRRNPHTDRSRAVTTGDLPPMAPPGVLVTNLGTEHGEIHKNYRDTVQQAGRLDIADVQL
jgi:hypothetical protein